MLDGSITFPPPGADRPWSVLVPTDLTPDSIACVRYAMELAATWSVRVDLLHVVETAYPGPHGEARFRLEDDVRRRLIELVPEELERLVECHVRFGDPSTEIATAAEILDPQAIVIGNHARGPLRRFFTRDTSRGVLQRTQIPTWIVPARWAA
jgi:nucleotide-binding universal stress UspA family protein